ncbi:MmgE/PrpD family protein [Arthrobacter sp. NPDC089319]|uniref:MmgE/PrpD family protein n=1 Tax=Arthrobacter sp. NPDC089319 TaxID=3155915 RepID=UPI00341E927B
MDPDNRDESLFHILAEFAHSVGGSSTPDRVRSEARLCLLDTLGCVLAGSNTREAIAFRQAEQHIAGVAHPLPTSVGSRVLGYMGDVLELNDLIGGHASIGIVTASISAAQNLQITGKQLTGAIIAGTEITARLYEAAVHTLKPFSESGMVTPGLFSAIGAAASLAYLRQLPLDTTAHAMAIAGAIASWGPAEVIFGNGGTIKPILFGASPADSAIKGIEYAIQGITGPLNLVESPLGMMAALAHGFREEALRAPNLWHLLRPQRKLHASCGYTHSSVDTMVELVSQGVDVVGAQRITVQVPEYILSAVRKASPPESPNEARFHLQYCVAIAASGADVIEPIHTLDFDRYIAMPMIQQLMERIEVEPLTKKSMNTAKPYNVSRILITDTDGSVLEGHCDAPRGSAANPLSDHDVIEKFRRLASGMLSEPEVEYIIRASLTFDGDDDQQWLRPIIDDLLQSRPGYNRTN